MDNWITATNRPPPASALSGMASAIQLHQPTGADVAIRPHRPSNATTAATHVPKGISARAMIAINAGMRINVRYKPRLRTAPIRVVPMKPATPIASRISDSVDTSTCVTVSRNGRKYVNNANWPKKNAPHPAMP
ncbi:hypothetical protein D3C72_1714140 [compost metagenome]